MRGFEYASPTTKEQAVSLLGNNWADADILAGGTDLLALMKDDVVAPKRLVRNALPGTPAVGFGNPGAVAYDSKRDQILVPN